MRIDRTHRPSWRHHARCRMIGVLHWPTNGLSLEGCVCGPVMDATCGRISDLLRLVGSEYERGEVAILASEAKMM